MEFYYHSPNQGYPPGPVRAPGPSVPPSPLGTGQPRRRRIPAFLVVSLALILALMAALTVLRILSWNGWISPLDDFTRRFRDPGFFSEDGSSDSGFGFDKEFDLPWDRDEGSPSSGTTIPRADPAPGVQLTLAAQPDLVLSYQDIYDKLIPSIVSIQAYGDDGAFEGTGVIMTADGYIVTNYHIISDCSSAQVVLSNGHRYTAKLVGCDAESDLAVLKVEAAGLVPAEFGNSGQLRVGDTALAIGNPLGSDLFGTMTEGIISALNRDVTVEGYDMTLIQTTAALNPGNSGGALLNCAGQVVGITNMKMMSEYETIEGLGFAIPTTRVQEVVNVLLSNGAITGRPTIGITCGTITTEVAEVDFGQDSGVYIESVTARGPADLAGVRAGDIVVAANGETVETMDDLTRIRDEVGVDGKLALTVWRDGEALELTLTLVEQDALN